MAATVSRLILPTASVILSVVIGVSYSVSVSSVFSDCGFEGGVTEGAGSRLEDAPAEGGLLRMVLELVVDFSFFLTFISGSYLMDSRVCRVKSRSAVTRTTARPGPSIWASISSAREAKSASKFRWYSYWLAISASAAVASEVNCRPLVSVTVTWSGRSPSTLPATIDTMDLACSRVKITPRRRVSRTLAVAGRDSRTNGEGSGWLMWTVAFSTPAICLMVLANSASRFFMIRKCLRAGSLIKESWRLSTEGGAELVRSPNAKLALLTRFCGTRTTDPE